MKSACEYVCLTEIEVLKCWINQKSIYSCMDKDQSYRNETRFLQKQPRNYKVYQFWMLQLLRRQHQWSQPKPNTHIRSITSLISDFCSQWNWKDAISAKNCLFFPSLLMTTESEIKTKWAQWKHTTWGQANTCASIRGWWVAGWSATGWAYPEDLFSLKRWREQPDRTPAVTLPTTECISMSTKISLPTTFLLKSAGVHSDKSSNVGNVFLKHL